MVNDDFVAAQKIISNTYNNFLGPNPFHHNSTIYKNSNEQISNYQKYLENKEKILSVTASGEQIINCILGGTKTIDTFDISTFPKYFLFLKLAAILTLTKEEYLNFFYRSITTSFDYYDYYDLIRTNLDLENKKFWDALFDYFDWYDIYNSRLFSSEGVSSKKAIKENKYLQDDNYQKLKSLIGKININSYTGNILNINTNFQDKYDLIYLSNIIYYEDLKKYKDMLTNFNLTNQGIILTYLYKVVPVLKNYFKESNFSFLEFPTTKDAILIYQKRP